MKIDFLLLNTRHMITNCYELSTLYNNSEGQIVKEQIIPIDYDIDHSYCPLYIPVQLYEPRL